MYIFEYFKINFLTVLIAIVYCNEDESDNKDKIDPNVQIEYDFQVLKKNLDDFKFEFKNFRSDNHFIRSSVEENKRRLKILEESVYIMKENTMRKFKQQTDIQVSFSCIIYCCKEASDFIGLLDYIH